MKSFEEISDKWATGLSVSLHRLLAEGALQRRVRRLRKMVGRDDGFVLLDLHRNGAISRPRMAQVGTSSTMKLLRRHGREESTTSWGRLPKAALEWRAVHRAELGPRACGARNFAGATRHKGGSGFLNSILLDKAGCSADAHAIVSIDDVGVATAFLATTPHGYMTVETLSVDGGYHIID